MPGVSSQDALGMHNGFALSNTNGASAIAARDYAFRNGHLFMMMEPWKKHLGEKNGASNVLELHRRLHNARGLAGS